MLPAISADFYAATACLALFHHHKRKQGHHDRVHWYVKGVAMHKNFCNRHNSCVSLCRHAEPHVCLQ